MSDGFLDIFAIEQRRLAAAAAKVGDTRTQAVHSAQADRFWEAQRKLDSEAKAAASDAEMSLLAPRHRTKTDIRMEAVYEMPNHVHIYHMSRIICKDRVFAREEFKSVRFRPDMDVSRFHKAFMATGYHKNLCPSCMLAARRMQK